MLATSKSGISPPTSSPTKVMEYFDVPAVDAVSRETWMECASWMLLSAPSASRTSDADAAAARGVVVETALTSHG
jgi:hypothetical protein